MAHKRNKNSALTNSSNADEKDVNAEVSGSEQFNVASADELFRVIQLTNSELLRAVTVNAITIVVVSSRFQ